MAAVAYILAGLTLFIFLRPDPLLVAKAITVEQQKQQHKLAETTIAVNNKINRIGIFVGALVLVLSQVIMVAIMTMTPIHMQGRGSNLSAIGMVIGLHVAAMYLPFLGTGLLVDKIG
ncbi:hypothetical protein [Lysinibacillus fusiformis]